MNKKFLTGVLVAFVVFALASCGDDGLSKSDVAKLVNGSNSVKGTISGTTLADSAFSFTYDYHVTTNDGNSYCESWVENDGTRVLYVYQQFYFDEHGYADYGDEWSPSGRYLELEFYMDMETMELMPSSYDVPSLEGLWHTITPTGSRFVYGLDFNNAGGTFEFDNFSYSSSKQILNGSFELDMPNDHSNDSWFENYNATTITGKFAIKIPKEAFKITSPDGYYGMEYRQRK